MMRPLTAQYDIAEPRKVGTLSGGDGIILTLCAHEGFLREKTNLDERHEVLNASAWAAA